MKLGKRPGVAILDMQMSKVPIISGYGTQWKTKVKKIIIK
jgi:hypothetical protein